jgi:Putative Actinobacterial Holin-X, holin superfamily III
MDTRSPQPAAPSLAALLGGIMHDAKDLLIQELTLATLEGHEELRHIKTAALWLGIGVGVATVGGMLLSMMLVQVLAAYTDMPLWGCYGIVGSVLVIENARTKRGGQSSASPAQYPAAMSSASPNGVSSESARPVRPR